MRKLAATRSPAHRFLRRIDLGSKGGNVCSDEPEEKKVAAKRRGRSARRDGRKGKKRSGDLGPEQSNQVEQHQHGNNYFQREHPPFIELIHHEFVKFSSRF